MGGGEEVIELSVDETNKLRAELGLPPLRGPGVKKTTKNDGGGNETNGSFASASASAPASSEKEVLEMSVGETNELRAKLGLKPLRTEDDGDEGSKKGRSAQHAVHKPAANEGENKQIRERIERARLERDVQKGIASRFDSKTLGDDSESNALSWAAKMRTSKKTTAASGPDTGNGDGNNDDEGKAETKKSKKAKKRKQKKNKALESKKKSVADVYGEEDLEGIQVTHAASDFQAGSTTVLTLADSELLETQENRKVVGLKGSEERLENVDLANKRAQEDGLRKKRQLELGMGRAGGYAGFDDDEFEELGGARGPSRLPRGASGPADNDDDNDGPKGGFKIGSSQREAENLAKEAKSIFAHEKGLATTLESERGNVMATDFLTAEEEDAIKPAGHHHKARKGDKKKKKDKKKKDKKEKKKDKKKDKKTKQVTEFKKTTSKKKNKASLRTLEIDDSDDDDDDEDGENNDTKMTEGRQMNDPAGTAKTSGSLLDELEETAVSDNQSSGRKRRRRNRDDDDSQAGRSNGFADQDTGAMDRAERSNDFDAVRKRVKYDSIMEKGNARTAAAFQTSRTNGGGGDDDDNDSAGRGGVVDEEPDDEFLNAALAKARRLKRLKDLAKKKKGADAVLEAVRSTAQVPAAVGSSSVTTTNGTPTTVSSGPDAGIKFEIDETSEFTRAMRARAEQQQRKEAKKAAATKAGNIVKTGGRPKVETVKEEPTGDAMEIDSGGKGSAKDVNDANGESLEEMAKQIEMEEDDEDDDFGGTNTGTKSVGLGLAGALGMLRQTGELNDRAGREELRGRAKDERTYDDYEDLDLRKVVKIGAGATDKDREFANREIKLEYRDDYGRLLTRKEAYRQMCYQFHGHGSSTKNQERRLQQIERERAEVRVASSQAGGGSMGALMATQKATKKAFVVHKM